MNLPQTIFTLPEQQLTPPEYKDWTEQDKRHAKEALIDRILGGEPWDENQEGWRGDMFVTWESIMLRCEAGDIDRLEAMAMMRDALYSHVQRHAQDEVEHDADYYCERAYD